MYDYNIKETDPVAEIEYAKNMYDAQVKKVNDEVYIRNLLKSNYVKQIKSYISRYDLIMDVFKKAHGQANEKLKKNRKEFEIIKEFIVDDFLDNNHSFKMKELICCGYENYAWAAKFEGYGQTFQITIPMKNNLDIKNIESAYNGMFAFSVKTYGAGELWSLLKKSYKIEDVADFIKEYFQLDKVNEDEY